jgi:protein phosphatase
MVRPVNEDRFLIKELAADTILLAVADGMGGMAAGRLAARITVDSLAASPPQPDETVNLPGRLVLAANRAVCAEARRHPALKGMGCTVTIATIQADEMTWAHVGDSRLYLFRDGILRQITTDHNLAQLLAEQGDLSQFEAKHSSARHILTQCVGQIDCRPDTGREPLLANDIVLLCTDGLHGTISDTNIALQLRRAVNLEIKAEGLINHALRSGGQDNVTVVMAENT